ncbi:hypothetical protein [Lacticaseibacillus kribbianus]|uniref:hypothetical protein n=1 Tax=Lacticaseibacillus kribbianus TaxID=2926292 RepID=UPI001CD3E4D9|nr:hypothetical protein [Lacticaseibacillus kribbianus]
MTGDIDTLLRRYDPVIRRAAQRFGPLDRYYGEALEIAWRFIAANHARFTDAQAADFGHLLAWRLRYSLLTRVRQDAGRKARERAAWSALALDARQTPDRSAVVAVRATIAAVWPRLTPLQRRVFALAYQRASNATIARELHLSHQRISQVRAEIRKKFTAFLAEK